MAAHDGAKRAPKIARNQRPKFAKYAARFIEIGSGTELARELAERGVTTGRGHRIDKKFIYRMLNNRVYIGEAVHKGTSYPGGHSAIIDRELWDEAHAILTVTGRLLPR